MKRSNNQKIGDVIRKLIQNPKISKKMDELDAIEAWEKCIAKPLHKYIKEQKIYKGILYIKITSSAMRNELSYKKTEILEEIKTKIGKEIITDIIFK